MASASRGWPSNVILSAAKDLGLRRIRFFATLRMTGLIGMGARSWYQEVHALGIGPGQSTWFLFYSSTSSARGIIIYYIEQDYQH